MNLFYQRLAVVASAAASALVLAAGAAAGDSVSRPDDRANHGTGAVAATQSSDSIRPDDRADRRLPNTRVVSQPPTSSGFDWPDAGIGAAAVLGLVFLIAGAMLVGLRQRRTTALP
jgi:hypothetical protein